MKLKHIFMAFLFASMVVGFTFREIFRMFGLVKSA